VKGAVKVQWSRAQEFQLGFHRPPSSHRIRARLSDRKLADWWHCFASSHILFTNAVVPSWLQKITDVVGDDGVARGARLPYKAKAKRTEFDLVRVPIYTGPWRGLGAGPNVFAIEVAMNQCAIQAKADPVQFRLDHIEDDRLAQVLQRVAQTANWGQPGIDRPGRRAGRGVACGIYKAMSYAAVVADVEVDEQTAAVRVTQMWCVHDCGQVINPDQVKAQCEGNLVWGLGMVLKESLPNSARGVEASTFAQSPIALFADVPKMMIDLVDNQHAPTGAGETAIVAAGAAIANAIRQATGFQIASLPLNPLKLAMHLQSSKKIHG
jgi:isoquinoline 1-oxidoreductase beta subunit